MTNDQKKQIEKDDWKTILGELDEIVRELQNLVLMIIGDVKTLEESFPTLNLFIKNIKGNNREWNTINEFFEKSKENLKLLEETSQLKQWHRRIERTIIGRLPRNTWQIGTNSMEIIESIPKVLHILNDKNQQMLNVINNKLLIENKTQTQTLEEMERQLSILQENIETHLKTKKGLLQRKGKLVYVQAYRETYLELINRAKNYTKKCYKIHSEIFASTADKLAFKLNEIATNPASNLELKELAKKGQAKIENYKNEGLEAFEKGYEIIKKGNELLSKRREAFEDQLRENFDNRIKKYLVQIKQLPNLLKTQYGKEQEKLSSIIDDLEEKINSVKDEIPVTKGEPMESLITHPQVVFIVKKIGKEIREQVFAEYLQKIMIIKEQIPMNKITNQIFHQLEKINEQATQPETLLDLLDVIEAVETYEDTISKLLKEISHDFIEMNNKLIILTEAINDKLANKEIITFRKTSEDELQLTKNNLDKLTPIHTLEDKMTKTIKEIVSFLVQYENKISKGLGFHINPQLEGKLAKYQRPTFKPTIKEGNKALNELNELTSTLANDTSEAIKKYAKELGEFVITSTPLKTLNNALSQFAEKIKHGDIALTEIIKQLEKEIKSYGKKIQQIINTHKNELLLIVTSPQTLNIIDKMSLENFQEKHENFIENLLLTKIAQFKDKETILKCKKCGAEIVWQQEEYNEMLGLDVLKVRCKNGHEDSILQFEEEGEEEEELIEVKCKECQQAPLTIKQVDLYSNNFLNILAICPNDHRNEFKL
jgi:hypothetical protein